MKKEYTIYGINNSENLLISKKPYSINKIYILKDGVAYKTKSIRNVINKMKNKVFYLDKKKFYNLFDYKHSQGIVINFLASFENSRLKYNDSKVNQCYIICDQITDPQNLGQIIRTSECAGIDGIILPKHGSVHVTNTVLQVSQGAFLYTDIFVVNNLANIIKEMKDEGYWVVGVENGVEAKKWYEIDFKGKIVIVVGSEGKGIRPLVKKSCDFLTTIPMPGKISSLNVSAALSAILFERQRQILSS